MTAITPRQQITMSPAECAAELGLNERTLANWRSGPPPHRGPLAIRIGDRVRYRIVDVDAYLDQQARAAARRSRRKAA